MTGLGTLRDLDLDHLHVWVRSPFTKFHDIELATLVTATEVPGADLPDQIAPGAQMVGTDRAFACVVREGAHACSVIERQYGVAAERTVAHGGDVEYAGGIRLRTVGTAHGHAQRTRLYMRGLHGVVDPLVAHLVHVTNRAERHGVAHLLGPLVHQRSLLPRKRSSAGLRLDEVLADLGANGLEDEPNVSDDRKIPQHRTLALEVILKTDGQYRHNQDETPQYRWPVQPDEGYGGEDDKGTDYKEPAHGNYLRVCQAPEPARGI